MKRADRWFVIGCLAVGLILAAVCYSPQPEPIEPMDSWHKSSLEAPPEERPIVGLWIWDGEPCPLTVVCIGTRYYAYNPGDITQLIADYAPNYWVDMPGVVK